MSTLSANGLTFNVVELGEGTGAPIVFVHGLLLGNVASFYFTCAPRLAARHRVLLFDLRGHGNSEVAKSGYDVVTMADDLVAICEQHPFTRDRTYSLVGHSYGALIALEVARRSAVQRLALIEAPLPPSSMHELDGFLASSPDKMLDVLPEQLRDAVGKGKRQAARFLARMHQLAFETTLLRDLREAKDVPDDVLRSIRVPTLCVYGTRSSCAPSGKRLAETMPNARLKMLEGGHFLHLDASHELGTLLEEHFDG